MSSQTKNILIVGGGSAAVTVAKELSKAVDPTRVTIQLVTERPYHIHYPGLLRMVVTPTGSLEKSALNPLDRIFAPGKAGEVIVGKVVSIEDGIAHVEGGRSLPYDFLVLATGTIWNGPLAFPTDVKERDTWIADWREKFANAHDVVLIGGGAVGTELAGEIRHFHPSTNVTIVHSDEYLLNDSYPVKFRDVATKRARGVGINIVLGDRADVPAEPYTSVTTGKGHKITADLVVPVWGGRPNTSFLSTFDPTILTPTGTVRVLPTLRVPLGNGKTNVYAVGDIIEWNEQKQLGKVPAMAGVVVPNILASLNEKPATAKYKGGFGGIVIPLGPKYGMSFLPLLWGIVLGDFSTSMIKGKTLLVSLGQGLLGYP